MRNYPYEADHPGLSGGLPQRSPVNDARRNFAPRTDGMFTRMLSGPIALLVRVRDDACSAYSRASRRGTGAVSATLYLISGAPTLPVFDSIVLVGLLPSAFLLVTGKHLP